MFKTFTTSLILNFKKCTFKKKAIKSVHLLLAVSIMKKFIQEQLNSSQLIDKAYITLLYGMYGHKGYTFRSFQV